MAAIVWADVLAFAAELTAVSDEARASILEAVNARLDPNALDGEDGPDTRLARIYLAAHLGVGAMPGASSAVGPVQSESGGRLSVTYAIVATRISDGDLESTSWGRKYRSLMDTSLARAWLVV